MLPTIKYAKRRLFRQTRMFWFKRRYFSDKRIYKTQPDFRFNLMTFNYDEFVQNSNQNTLNIARKP